MVVFERGFGKYKVSVAVNFHVAEILRNIRRIPVIKKGNDRCRLYKHFLCLLKKRLALVTALGECLLDQSIVLCADKAADVLAGNGSV